MTSTPCLYAIIRFCPFVETEEFANVGIIMMAPEQRFFAYKLMTRKHARVTNFFEQLDGAVFKNAIYNLKYELDRASSLLKSHGFDKRQKFNDVAFARKLFYEITRPRETVIKFSQIRAVLTDDPKNKLDDLYGHYVERDFVTKEYKETVLERAMRRWIHDAGLSNRFERLDVGNDEYHATFPFVEHYNHHYLKAVKPLNLAQDQPSKIMDHGGQWLYRISTLRRRQLLPEKIMFAVEGPSEPGARRNAYEDIVADLKSMGAVVLPYDEKNQIMDFVTQES